ncbi:hypothetical protein [Nocardia gipuzkoensis]|uniref:hypothetical protein n=1 Tax=Nocardia gipuzkoensis TaxID=2749991 RepID=UPI00237E683A|nr:hypothetical protein [Nocardia gipuzkoensis]MDE1674712.1 hypothetical protein [Nocardia gipuzkoensis]
MNTRHLAAVIGMAITTLTAAPAPASNPPVPVVTSDFNRYPVDTPCALGPGPLGRIIDAGRGHHICEQRTPGTNSYYE